MGYVTPIPAQNPQTVVVNGGFDAGARFGVGSQPNIPVSPVIISDNFWHKVTKILMIRYQFEQISFQ